VWLNGNGFPCLPRIEPTEVAVAFAAFLAGLRTAWQSGEVRPTA
jgi:hypothetical protein